MTRALRTGACALLAVATVGLVPTGATAAPTVTTIELAPLGVGPDGFELVNPVAVNATGQVVGESSSSAGRRAFIWKDGTTRELAGLGGASIATDINDRGWVVGRSATADGDVHGVLWRNGRVVDLGPADSYLDLKINARGQVGLIGDDLRAFRWQDGRRTDITQPGREGLSIGVIDDAGNVLVHGYDDTAEGWLGGYIYRNGRIVELPEPPGAGNAAALVDLNQRGEAIYTSGPMDDDSLIRSNLWRRGRTTDIAPVGGGFAEDINDRGDVVGTSRTHVWDDGCGEREDCGSSIDTSWVRYGDGTFADPGQFNFGARINNRGVIAGTRPVATWEDDPAVVWQNGTTTVLPTDETEDRRVLDLNDRGDVIGTAGRHGYLWRVRGQ